MCGEQLPLAAQITAEPFTPPRYQVVTRDAEAAVRRASLAERLLAEQTALLATHRQVEAALRDEIKFLRSVIRGLIK